MNNIQKNFKAKGLRAGGKYATGLAGFNDPIGSLQSMAESDPIRETKLAQLGGGWKLQLEEAQRKKDRAEEVLSSLPGYNSGSAGVQSTTVPVGFGAGRGVNPSQSGLAGGLQRAVLRRDARMQEVLSDAPAQAAPAVVASPQDQRAVSNAAYANKISAQPVAAVKPVYKTLNGQPYASGRVSRKDFDHLTSQGFDPANYGYDAVEGVPLQQVLRERVKAPGLSRGAVIPGHDTQGSDDVPIRVTRGEAVLPVKTVDAMGGPEAVEKLITATNGRPPADGLRSGLKAAHGMMDSIIEDDLRAEQPRVRPSPTSAAETAGRGKLPYEKRVNKSLGGSMNYRTPPSPAGNPTAAEGVTQKAKGMWDALKTKAGTVKPSSMGSSALKMAGKAAVLAGAGKTIYDTANVEDQTDLTDRYAQRFGVDAPTGDGSFGDVAKFAAIRAGGFASDLGNTLTGGLAGALYRAEPSKVTPVQKQPDPQDAAQKAEEAKQAAVEQANLKQAAKTAVLGGAVTDGQYDAPQQTAVHGAMDDHMAKQGITVDRSAPKLGLEQAVMNSNQAGGMDGPQRLNYGDHTEVYGQFKGAPSGEDGAKTPAELNKRLLKIQQDEGRPNSNQFSGAEIDEINKGIRARGLSGASFTAVGDGSRWETRPENVQAHQEAVARAAKEKAGLNASIMARASSGNRDDYNFALQQAAGDGALTAAVTAANKQAQLHDEAVRRDPAGVYKQMIESEGKASDRALQNQLLAADRAEKNAIRRDTLAVAQGNAQRQGQQDALAQKNKMYDRRVGQLKDLATGSDGKPDMERFNLMKGFIDRGLAEGKFSLEDLDDPSFDAQLDKARIAGLPQTLNWLKSITGFNDPKVTTAQDAVIDHYEPSVLGEVAVLRNNATRRNRDIQGGGIGPMADPVDSSQVRRDKRDLSYSQRGA